MCGVAADFSYQMADFPLPFTHLPRTINQAHHVAAAVEDIPVAADRPI